MGVRREAEGLTEAAEKHRPLVRATCWPRQFADPVGWELQNMLCVARLMIDAALCEESRGAHMRTDFPQLDDEHWQRHITFLPERRNVAKPLVPKAPPGNTLFRGSASQVAN